MEPFNLMLVDLSRKLRKEDFESIKFCCQKVIPAGRLEQVDTPLQLWVLLQERADLSPDNTQILTDLIKSTGRSDLLQIIEAYDNKTYTNCQHSAPSSSYKQEVASKGKIVEIEREIELIVSEIGRDWKRFARKLQLSDADIDYITDNFTRNSRECCRQSILTWYERRPSTVDISPVQQLITALRSCQLNLIADLLSDLPTRN
ncbi:unnamed protein product [Dimorphilus gyrociliatus]|uniref:Uncharacterized protein n=1 Tax=Dimorphilus gyrociliatus TaxID=2664684 RepID=A0A7I8VGF7_9ANNE|nr:unnamed protein product [Dimorphilus gyrociliatus]